MTRETSRSSAVTIWRRRSMSCSGPVGVLLTRCITLLPPARSFEKSSEVAPHDRPLLAGNEVPLRGHLPRLLGSTQLGDVSAADCWVGACLIFGAVGRSDPGPPAEPRWYLHALPCRIQPRRLVADGL